jgi:hypothetical protein
MVRTLDDLLKLVRTGASLDFHIGMLTHGDLMYLGRNLNKDATMVLRSVNMLSTEQLVQIKQVSKGAVVFVLD